MIALKIHILCLPLSLEAPFNIQNIISVIGILVEYAHKINHTEQLVYMHIALEVFHLNHIKTMYYDD